MKRLLDKVKLSYTVNELRRRSFQVKKIEISQVSKGMYLCSAYNKAGSHIISEDVKNGLGDNPYKATLIALSEFVERAAFAEAQNSDHNSGATVRSDGYAAYPIYFGFHKRAASHARRNAFNEAVERFAWSTWWDNSSIGFDLSDITHTKDGKFIIKHLITHKPVEQILLISPFLERGVGQALKIYLVALKGGGYITGGCAEDGGSMSRSTFYPRAFSELFRHCLALQRIADGLPFSQDNFYIKRLEFFGLGHGDHLVQQRLQSRGSSSVQFPNLLIDKAFKHQLDDIYVVHRCLFENQPVFMGGDLHRLCI